AAYDEDVVSLNDDDNTAGAESETVMSVIDGDKPDHDDDSSPDSLATALSSFLSCLFYAPLLPRISIFPECSYLILLPLSYRHVY
ncbi:hypothetical protein ONO39_26185, partial [Salmonella enterica subsp. enterica serovar Anatum]|nr:hypothetical protein [Salmonella enterica subsp. enterica serovar Anatum]